MSKQDLQDALRLARAELAEARKERDHYKMQRDELTQALLGLPPKRSACVGTVAEFRALDLDSLASGSGVRS